MGSKMKVGEIWKYKLSIEEGRIKDITYEWIPVCGEKDYIIHFSYFSSPDLVSRWKRTSFLKKFQKVSK